MAAHHYHEFEDFEDPGPQGERSNMSTAGINATPVDFSRMHLGCKPSSPVKLARGLKLAKYLSPSRLPTPPEATNWRAAVKEWGMLGNDKAGCCVVAGTAHTQMCWGANTGQHVSITTDEVIKLYSHLSGYDPVTGVNDNGCSLVEALDDWRKHGAFGNRLGAHAQINSADHTTAIQAISLLGPVKCAVALPLAWQNAEVWTAPSDYHLHGKWAPNSWGGHDVEGVDYDDQHLYVVTWGRIMPVTWQAVRVYFPEMHAMLDSLWLGDKRIAPSGFDIETLANDLAVLTSC